MYGHLYLKRSRETNVLTSPLSIDHRIVRTVRGDIDPSELGATDAHEHLFFVTPLQPGDGFTELEPAIEEARTLVAAGGRALVDWTPLGLGRNPEGLLGVAEATGVRVARRSCS
jgi:predicted metal-dependent phosphotriesterase family hydrolase